MAQSRLILFLGVVYLALSSALAAGTVVSKLSDPDNPNIPADAKLDSCFAHEFTPAIIETITERTPKTPAQVAIDETTGQTKVIRPATYETVTVQKIIQDRRDIWFETPCPQIYTERFVKSLQRALKARGYYSGTLTGWMDKYTRIAVQLYQRDRGYDSEILSLKVAEEFGLITHRDFEGMTRNN